MTKVEEIEAAIRTMKANGTYRTAPGRYRLLKERLAKLKKPADAAGREVAAVRHAQGEALKQETLDRLAPPLPTPWAAEWKGMYGAQVRAIDKTGIAQIGSLGGQDAEMRLAQLIAAAPELLAACKLAVERACGWSDNLSSFNSGQPKGSEAERIIRAAIAKAEGRAL